MAELKTKKTEFSPKEFVESVEDGTRREDGLKLLSIFKDITGQDPKMWGTSIVGFGEYHYKSERSRQEGDWPLVGFSPRKQNLTLYLMPNEPEVMELLPQLGKHKTSVSCVYINKLEDVDAKVLEQVIKKSYEIAKKKLT